MMLEARLSVLTGLWHKTLNDIVNIYKENSLI